MERHLARRPEALPGARQIVFITLDIPTYTADLVQNDPFLRSRVWYMLSTGPKRDAEFMHARFPKARIAAQDRRGAVWLLK
jgi:hypothetical protein